MREAILPKTIEKWIEKNQDKVEDWHFEDDGCWDGHLSLWVDLKDGWRTDDDTSTLHVHTAKDFLNEASWIKKTEKRWS